MVRVGFWYAGGRGLDSPVGHNFFLGKTGLYRVPEKDTRQNLILPSAISYTLGILIFQMQFTPFR